MFSSDYRTRTSTRRASRCRGRSGARTSRGSSPETPAGCTTCRASCRCPNPRPGRTAPEAGPTDDFSSPRPSQAGRQPRGGAHGAIHVHEFMTLDGVVDAPTWTFEYGFDPKMGEALAAVTGRAEGILLGAPPSRCSSRVVHADGRGRSRRAVLQRHDQVRRLRTLTDPTWSNSRGRRPLRRRRDPRAEGRRRRRSYVSGSITLVRAMLADGLIDGLHLFVYPLTLGAGPRLFPEGAAPAS